MVYLSNKNNIKTNAILYDSFVSLLDFVIITLSLVSIQISLMKAIVNLLKCQNFFFLTTIRLIGKVTCCRPPKLQIGSLS